MPETIEQAIRDRVQQTAAGTLFFSETFVDIGNAKAVAKALERLTQKGEIQRLAHGIYLKPEIDPVIGPVTPGIDVIAEAIAERDKARIVPTGAYALNRLGLSTQMPMNLVYLTDSAARQVKIGKRTITFKKATPKNVAAIGPISRLVIQALRAIGKNKLTEEEKEKIVAALQKENPANLRHDIVLAPEWIRNIIRPVLNEGRNEPKRTAGVA